MAARVMSRGITFLKVITGFVSGFICISVAGWLAPVHETAAMIVLAIVTASTGPPRLVKLQP